MNKTLKILFLIMATLFIGGNAEACKKSRIFKIDYTGKAEFYSTPDGHPIPRKAKVGEQVIVSFPLVATDTKYEFYLDDEQLNPRYNHEHGYIINFVMPDHDVKLTCVRSNISVEETDENNKGSSTSLDDNSQSNIYTIDFCGQDYDYANEITKNGVPQFVPVRKQYKAGEEVVIFYPRIATDTDYSFILDGKQIRPDYQTRKGYIIRFTMPDHNVSLKCISRNSMLRR